MADTISRRSVVYDLIFNTDQAGPATANVEKALKNVDKGANEAEKAVKSLGDQFLQFAGVQSQIDQVKNAMTAFKVATAGVTSGMKLLKVALAATGIGALVVALGSVITYLTQTQRGMELVEKATNALGAAFNVIVDRVSGFGEGLALIFSGKFQQGADKLRNSFKGIGDELKREISAAADLTDALDAVDDKERDLILTQAQRKKQISELRLIAKDEAKTLQERRAALQQAIDLENKILDDELSIARERARISDERTRMAESTDEELEANIRLQARVIELETEANDKKRALIRELNTLTKQTFEEQVNLLKAVRDEQLLLNTETEAGAVRYRALEKEAQRLKTTLEGILDVQGKSLNATKEEISAQHLFRMSQNLSYRDIIDGKEAIIKASQKEFQIQRKINLEYKETKNVVDGYLELKLLQDEIELRNQLNSVLATSGEALGTLAGIAKQGSELQLALAISSILVNQAQAISAAIKGATEAAAATGPGAVVATPAFIATMVGSVIATFAQVFSVINQAKAAQSKANAFAEGEIDIHRPGETRGKDSIPAVIMPGESVITTEKTSKYKPFLRAIHEGTLEDLIRVNYVEPALAISAMDQAQKDSAIDYSHRFYKQLLATHDGNSIGKRTVQTLERIEKKIGNQKPSWYV